MVRLIRIPFLILMCAMIFAFLTGMQYEFSFAGLLQIFEEAPVVDFTWLNIPPIAVGEAEGIFAWLINFINVLIDIVDFVLMIVKGFLQLFTYIFYFVRRLFVPSM